MKQLNQIDVFVGNRIRMRRLDLKLSQMILADKLGVTFQQIQKYERGINRVPASRLHVISIILDVPVSHFFDRAPLDTPESREISQLEQSLVKKDVHRLNAAYARISCQALRRSIVSMIEAIANAEDQETGEHKRQEKHGGLEGSP